MASNTGHSTYCQPQHLINLMVQKSPVGLNSDRNLITSTGMPPTNLYNTYQREVSSPVSSATKYHQSLPSDIPIIKIALSSSSNTLNTMCLRGQTANCYQNTNQKSEFASSKAKVMTEASIWVHHTQQCNPCTLAMFVRYFLMVDPPL